MVYYHRGGDSMLEVITGNDLYSVWGSYILDKLTTADINFHFTKGLKLEDLRELAIGENTYGVVLLGKSLQESQVETINEIMQEITDQPFTKGYHFANWGETLGIDVSVVDNEINFVSKLVEEITLNPDFIKFKDEGSQKFAEDIAEALQSHHKYDGGAVGKRLMLLAELYGEDLLFRNYESIEDIGTIEGLTVQRLEKNMKTYTQKKVDEANLQVLDSGVIVVSLFAEKHVNELGKLFIDSLSANGSKVVVLIGKQTRGDDIYHIRTSLGVSASDVAYALNKGKGKERAATVFLPKGNQAIYNTIYTVLKAKI